MNDLEEVLHEFERLDRVRTDAAAWIAAAEQIVEIDPGRIDVWSKLAEQYEHRGEWGRAVAEWSALAERNPDEPAVRARLRKAERIADSGVRRRAEREQAAEEAERERRERAAQARRAIEASTDYSELLDLGFRWRRSGDEDAARLAFDRAVELALSQDPAEIRDVALSLRRQGMPSVALPLAERAAAKLRDTRSRVILARTQRSLGRHEEARATYDDALAVATGRRDRIIALTGLGAIYRDLDQPALAERAARSALGEDPRDSWALNLLGGALYDQGQYEEAVESFERAVQYGVAIDLSGRATLSRLLDRLLDRDDQEAAVRVQRLLESVSRPGDPPD